VKPLPKAATPTGVGSVDIQPKDHTFRGEMGSGEVQSGPRFQEQAAPESAPCPEGQAAGGTGLHCRRMQAVTLRLLRTTHLVIRISVPLGMNGLLAGTVEGDMRQNATMGAELHPHMQAGNQEGARSRGGGRDAPASCPESPPSSGGNHGPGIPTVRGKKAPKQGDLRQGPCQLATQRVHAGSAFRRSGAAELLL